MSRAALPGPFRRLLRQPLRAGAIALLAVTALAASGIQNAAAAALRDTVDENWRGAYDILVTPDDAMDAIDGMLPPNTLASTGSGMSLADVEGVRAVDGVEVAAPIGEVLVPALRFGQARVAVPRGFVGADAEPQAFRVTTTYTTDDGLGERLVEKRSINIVIDEATDERPEPDFAGCASNQSTWQGRFGDYAVDETYPALVRYSCGAGRHGDGITVYDTASTTSWMWNGDSYWAPDPTLSFQLPSAPQTITRITLVDPIAERELLGEQGSFLDPLVALDPAGGVSVDEVTAWARADDTAFGTAFLDQLVRFAAFEESGGFADEILADLRRLFAENGDDWDEAQRENAVEANYVPLIVGDAPVAQLSLKIDVEAFGAAAVAPDPNGGMTGFELPEALASGEPGQFVGSAVGDVSGLLNPFSSAASDLVWPGADLETAAQLPDYRTIQIMAVGDVRSAEYRSASGAVTLDATGYQSPIVANSPIDAAFSLGSDPAAPGAEAAYVGVDPTWSVFDRSSGGASLAAVAVGEFDPDEVGVDEAAADYVPLGAYSPVSSLVTAGDNAGTAMEPSLTGLGLVSPRTAAIASLGSAELWDDDTPVSAIRVRVGGIDEYTAAARDRVIEVAQALEKLGFSATIVAGSSPADLAVQVEGYAFGTMDAGAEQSVGALGAVTQRWSELGAAARVSLSVSTATLAILGIALAAGILLLGAVQLAGIPGRREQSVAMREVGFTRAGIARWFAAEEAPGLLVVALVGAAAWFISAGTGIAAIAGASAVGAVLVTSVVSVVAGSRVTGLRMPRDTRSRRLGARSTAGFGIRQALVHPLTSLTHLLAIAIVGLSAAALAAALLTGREAAGQSSLALLALGLQLVPQVALGLAGIVAGVLLARLTRRLDLARRSDQWGVLRAAGWTSGQLATAQRAEGVAIVVPAIVVTATLAYVGTQWLEIEPWRTYVGVAIVAALLTALIAFTTRRKGTAT